jgi:hypothetical protein
MTDEITRSTTDACGRESALDSLGFVTFVDLPPTRLAANAGAVA